VQGQCRPRVPYATLPHAAQLPARAASGHWTSRIKPRDDVRILPLHPALTFAGIQAIAQHGCVCVSNADGTHKVHRLSAKAVELVVKLKQYMCLNWSDLQPWASDALGESWPEQSLAADGSGACVHGASWGMTS